jgi:hypothetical protein
MLSKKLSVVIFKRDFLFAFVSKNLPNNPLQRLKGAI